MKKCFTIIWSFTLLFILPILSYGQFNIEFEPIPNAQSINSPNPVQALDISYNDIDETRQAFHIFLPDTVGTFPLVIYYHGGGFTGGSRDVVFSDTGIQKDLKFFLENGIAFASAGYRLIESNTADPEGVIKPLNDSKRALQFIRHHASDLKIAPSRIALAGGSAGAGTALWLATRDDMADPSSPDPVLRESTRVSAVQLGASQATYDIFKWESVVYTDFGFTLEDAIDLLGFDRFSNFYGGIDSANQILHDPALIQYRKDVDMLQHMSPDDPPIYVVNGSSATIPSEDLFHHSSHAVTIQTHAIEANIPEVKVQVALLNIDTSEGESSEEFLLRHLNNESVVLSTTDEEVIDHVNIYPNPTTAKLYVQSNLAASQYWIYNLYGQLILSGYEKEIDVSTIPDGAYFIKVNSRISRFIKQ